MAGIGGSLQTTSGAAEPLVGNATHRSRDNTLGSCRNRCLWSRRRREESNSPGGTLVSRIEGMRDPLGHWHIVGAGASPGCFRCLGRADRHRPSTAGARLVAAPGCWLNRPRQSTRVGSARASGYLSFEEMHRVDAALRTVLDLKRAADRGIVLKPLVDKGIGVSMHVSKPTTFAGNPAVFDSVVFVRLKWGSSAPRFDRVSARCCRSCLRVCHAGSNLVLRQR